MSYVNSFLSYALATAEPASELKDKKNYFIPNGGATEIWSYQAGSAAAIDGTTVIGANGGRFHRMPMPTSAGSSLVLADRKKYTAQAAYIAELTPSILDTDPSVYVSVIVDPANPAAAPVYRYTDALLNILTAPTAHAATHLAEAADSVTAAQYSVVPVADFTTAAVVTNVEDYQTAIVDVTNTDGAVAWTDFSLQFLSYAGDTDPVVFDAAGALLTPFAGIVEASGDSPVPIANVWGSDPITLAAGGSAKLRLDLTGFHSISIQATSAPSSGQIRLDKSTLPR